MALYRYHGNHLLQAGAHALPCVHGKGGLLPATDKREGDGATPCGLWQILAVYYRADRAPRPNLSYCPVYAIKPFDGWCDDMHWRGHYNRYLRLPHQARHENLWRHDRMYDVVVVLDHNQAGKIPFGSAIFLHLWRDPMTPTEGCLAFKRPDLWQLIHRWQKHDRLLIAK